MFTGKYNKRKYFTGDELLVGCRLTKNKRTSDKKVTKGGGTGGA